MARIDAGYAPPVCSFRSGPTANLSVVSVALSTFNSRNFVFEPRGWSMNRRNKNRPSGQRDDQTGGNQPDGNEAVGDEVKLSPAAARAQEIRTGAQRETVEAFVVAFILALLFRAFLAEAFVIPTGSMAPTLMGAHKEIDCDRCGQRFRIGASWEQRGPVTENVVVGGVCPNCRHANSLDLRNEANDATFSGDRILVSKFSYALSDPERWDVIVFKFPGNPKQNYIKRLVGLPEETVTLRHGDVYARPTGSQDADQILRKPDRTLLSMRHLVYDSDHQSPELIQADYPSRFQPWRPGATQPPQDSWQVSRDDDGMTARLDTAPASGTQWLRYYHRWPSQSQWDQADQGLSLASVDPYSSRAITDFYQYNSFAIVEAGAIYNTKPATFRGNGLSRMLGGGYGGGEFRDDFQSGGDLEQFSRCQFGTYQTGTDGMHWVGDLMIQTDIETDADAKTATLELVESGVQFRCDIDLSDGTAKLSILRDGQSFAFDDDVATPSASTDVRAGGRHQIRFSNFDDQLLLWVDGDLVSFDSPTSYAGLSIVPFDQRRPRFDGPGNPLDAAPAAIGVDGAATVHQVRIDRDKYYVATTDSRGGVHDYDLRLVSEVGGAMDMSGWGPQLQARLADRESWETLSIWNARRSAEFVMEKDQFFPMGDNSPESLDARCWAGTKEFGQPRSVDEDAYLYSEAHYVPRDLLVGKALLVFWPHPWNRPIPFTPNFKRMKLIR